MPAPRQRRRRTRRFRGLAGQQAGAEYNPQIAQVRRDTGAQVRSVRSMGRALQGGLSSAERGIRRAGLMADDRQLALREIAMRRADAAAGSNLQVGDIRRESQGQIADLVTARSQAESSIFGELQQQAREQAQARRSDIRDRNLDLKYGLIGDLLAQQLGIGGESEGGLTPYQQRGVREERDSAQFYAKQLFQKAKAGELGDLGDPKDWDDVAWGQIAGEVAAQEGVDGASAQRAVQRIREHVAGGGGLGDVAQTGAQLGAVAGGLAGQNPDLPEPLQALAQMLFGR